jgi:hypothetical protein
MILFEDPIFVAGVEFYDHINHKFANCMNASLIIMIRLTDL